MRTNLPTKFLFSRSVATLTAALMLSIVVLVGLSVTGVFERGTLGVPIRWEPLRLWALMWCAASGLYALLHGALSREILRLEPGYPVPPGRAMWVAGLPVVNVMLLPSLFDEAGRFVSERLDDPALEQKLRMLSRAPAAITIGGLIGLLLLGIVLPGLLPKAAAAAALALLSLTWLVSPPLLRLAHLVVLRRALCDVVVREAAVRARARHQVPVAG